MLFDCDFVQASRVVRSYLRQSHLPADRAEEARTFWDFVEHDDLPYASIPVRIDIAGSP